MLPQAFLDRMKEQLGGEFDEYIASLDRPRAVALRFHPKKQVDLPFLQEKVEWEPLGYYYDPESRPGLHPYHEAGVYYLQEASAMSAVSLLDPQPGEKICDLCAAPGGKTTQIAGRMGGKQVTVQNLDVVKVDIERNLIIVKGAVPGPKGGIVTIKNTVKA